MRGAVRSWLLPLVFLLAILALPFIAKRSAGRDDTHPSAGTGGETLVIITPHNEAIRHEFTEAFSALMARQGRRVQIDWRSPGGGSEINRVLAAEYAASFERYWTGPLGRRWSGHARAFAAEPPPGAAPDPEAAEARRAFLDSSVGCGIDLLFGGGSVDAQMHASAGRLVDAGIVKAHPELFGEAGIPAVVGGEP